MDYLSTATRQSTYSPVRMSKSSCLLLHKRQPIEPCETGGGVCVSAVENLPSMRKGLGSILSITKQTNSFCAPWSSLRTSAP